MSSDAIRLPVKAKDNGPALPAQLYERMGILRLDLASGEWQAWNDLANYSFVRYPEQDEKYYSRELLRILGKRFSNVEAGVIWQEIEHYRREFVALYGPPQGAVGGPSFEQAAGEWYSKYGRGFEKEWFLRIPLDLHYARAGLERVRGRWLRLLHPDLLPFIEAGFSPWEVLSALHDPAWGGWFGLLRRWRQADEGELARMWAVLSARLLGFNLDQSGLEQALVEITLYSNRLSRAQAQAVRQVQATLEYFRRLELAGLNTVE